MEKPSLGEDEWRDGEEERGGRGKKERWRRRVKWEK